MLARRVIVTRASRGMLAFGVCFAQLAAAEPAPTSPPEPTTQTEPAESGPGKSRASSEQLESAESQEATTEPTPERGLWKPKPIESAQLEPVKSWTVPTLHTLGLFTTLRLSEAYLYPDPFAETRLRVLGERYYQTFTKPPKFDASKPFFEWDGDPWYINAVGHGLMGSEVYLRARTCGQDVLPSLLFTAGSTVVWDYAFEGNGVRPSALDLVYTPASGIALGELRYFVWSQAKHIKETFWRGLVRGVFDPLGEVERWAGTPC